jgi:hypothetical protein
MTDRTRTMNWFIDCRSQNCNRLDTGRLIHDNSHISFDFDTFFGSNISSKHTMSSFLIKIALITMTCIIKIFY